MQEFEDLVDAAQRGDRSAQSALLEKQMDSLRAFVRLRVGADLRIRESLSDFVQTVCRQALVDLPSFRGQSEPAFCAWLLTMASRKVHDRRKYWGAEKRGKGRPDRALSDMEEEALRRSYTKVHSPVGLAIAHEANRNLEAAFDRLTEDQRDVLTLACLGGLSHAEIAERTGRTSEASRALLTRARARLAMILAGDDL